VLKKMKELDARERTNIEELKIDKRLTKPEPLPTDFLDPEPAPGVSPGPAGSF
jgi:hypothetical protein